MAGRCAFVLSQTCRVPIQMSNHRAVRLKLICDVMCRLYLNLKKKKDMSAATLLCGLLPRGAAH